MPTIDQQPTAAAVAKHEHQVRAFQAHAAVAVGTLTLILAVNLLTNLSTGTTGDFSAWWSLWAIVGWIPGLGIHGLVVWLAKPRSHTHDGLAVR
ncbi:MAG: 2TM domain-containing protein [Thermoanaerobaculia bacterium]